MFTTILIIIIILIGLFVFNERINQLVKSLFNSKIDRIEEENTDSILDQVTRKTRQKDAEINQAQAKIIAQMNTLKYQKQELEQIIIETQSKAKQLKDLYLTTNDESKKDLAIAVLETIADEKIQLASLEKTILSLEPAFSNAQKMAEQARKSNEEQRTQIEVTRMETNSAKASQMIANSNTTFDVNSVDTTTEETLRKIKKKNSEFNSQLEVANIVNKDKLRLSEAESAINKMNSDKAFDNL